MVKREATNVILDSGQPLGPEVERTCDLPGAPLHRGDGAADLDVGAGRSGQESPDEDLAERPALQCPRREQDGDRRVRKFRTDHPPFLVESDVPSRLGPGGLALGPAD